MVHHKVDLIIQPWTNTQNAMSHLTRVTQLFSGTISTKTWLSWLGYIKFTHCAFSGLPAFGLSCLRWDGKKQTDFGSTEGLLVVYLAQNARNGMFICLEIICHSTGTTTTATVAIIINANNSHLLNVYYETRNIFSTSHTLTHFIISKVCFWNWGAKRSDNLLRIMKITANGEHAFWKYVFVIASWNQLHICITHRFLSPT